MTKIINIVDKSILNSSHKIKTFILENITRNEKNIIQAAIEHFGVSRQAIHKHMNSLIDDKKVIAYGTTKARQYQLNPIVNLNKTINISSNNSSESIMKNYIAPHLTFLEKNIFDIFHFSIFSLIDNVFVHSTSHKIFYKIYVTHKESHFILNDNGVGIFDHIRSQLGLSDIFSAAFELSKGKLSINLKKRSVDNLYALIHLFDNVSIESNGINLRFINRGSKWQISNSLQKKGTKIHLIIDTSSKRSCSQIFKRIFNLNEKRIRIAMNLLDISDYKIFNSRSKAKKAVRNIVDYNLIEFDFNKIDLIGPSFADELIRRTKEKNKFAKIKWINSNDTVDLLLSRALNYQS